MATLTNQEQEKSLMKGKRKRHEKAPKIVLCNPFEKYWPLLNEDNCEKLEHLLKSVLRREKEKQKIPWKKLIKLPKEIRKKCTKELNQKNPPSEELLRQRKCIKFGLNSVSRGVQNFRINSCLLAADVEPDIIIKHVVTLALTRGIPLLIVPKLKKITSQIIGFPCTALGIIVNESDQYFKTLNEMIQSLSLQFPLPSNYACYLRKQRSLTEKRKKSVPKKVKSKVDSDNINSSSAEQTSKPCRTPVSDTTSATSSDFIPLTVERNVDKLPTDILNRIQYLRPKFKRVPVNANKIRRKKKEKPNK